MRDGPFFVPERPENLKKPVQTPPLLLAKPGESEYTMDTMKLKE